MRVTLLEGGEVSRLVFEGDMTLEFSNEMEDRILGAMRRRKPVQVDLSAVEEIDLCGLHMLGMMQTMGKDKMDIVATSPAVDRRFRTLLSN
ncbi:MAG TPA: STAS domain-containing protein [Aromatoleum sp.]|uniref:STAS domain-containing protein n=1 Tax=Aromatoleum sp. TaxID=2307007 RepID=UPI002B493923|nr:STAS domain-containing protein [Aromatoleum sp.]HJV25607.1 STAS domain-containing protein [Aromatoleum sp.]